MPKIPVYDSPQVQQQPLAIPKWDVNVPRGAFGEGIAQGLDNAASTMFGVSQDLQRKQKIKEDEDNQFRVHAAITQQNAADEQFTTKAQTMVGEQFLKPNDNGISPGDQILRDRKDAQQKIAEGLGNEHQRKMFMLASDDTAIHLKSTLDNHFIQQDKVQKEKDYEASAQSNLAYALAYPADENGIKLRKDNLIQMADLIHKGDSTLTRETALARIEADTGYAQVQGMIDSDPVGATAKFKELEAKHLIQANPNYSALKVKIDGESNFAVAKGIADSYIHAASTPAVNPDTNIAKNDWEGKRAELITALVNKPQRVIEQSLQLFDNAHAQSNAQVAADVNSAQAAVSMIASTQGPGKALVSKELRAMQANPRTSEAAYAFKRQLESDIEARTNRARANADKVDPATVAKQGFLFNDMLKRAMNQNITRDEVIAQSTQMGKSMTKQLVDVIGDMERAPVKAHQYSVDSDIMESSLRHAGLISDKQTDAQKSLIGDLHAKVITMQSASGKPWSQEQTQKLVDELVTPIITSPSNHWWTTSSDPVPAFKAAEQVPQSFISQTLKRKPGYTNNQITTAYYQLKQAGHLNDDGTYKDGQ